MRRKSTPVVDLLESRALLTGYPGPIHVPTAPTIPAGVTASIAVSAPTIAPQGTVNLSLVETNTTSNTVTFSVPSNQLGFQIFERGVEVWHSQASPSQATKLVTLAPGQSTTIYSATWDDTGNVHTPTTTGTFSVVSSFAPAAPAATVTVTNGSDSVNDPSGPSTPVVFGKNPPKLHPTF